MPLASVVEISSSARTLRYTAAVQCSACAPSPQRPWPPSSSVVALCIFRRTSSALAVAGLLGATVALTISQKLGASWLRLRLAHRRVVGVAAQFRPILGV